MKELIKCYHVFIPRTWEKLLLYLIYPVVLICVGRKLEGILSLFGIIFTCEWIVLIELLLDSLIFGGISSKDTNKLEYLKTSVKGMTVLRKSIFADAVRRALAVTMILAAVYAKNSADLPFVRLVMCVLTSFFLTELALVMTRYFSSMVFLMVIVSVVEIINLAVLAAIFSWEIPAWGTGPAATLCILAAVAGRTIIMRNARKSYYDDRD